jgi:cell cycle arrest protein BUB2
MSLSPHKRPVSPTKETFTTLAPPADTSLQPPPSPGSHRALRRLQSAISLGQSSSQSSLISQQHRAIHRANSPSKDSLHSRGRSNSDATNMTPPILGAAVRRPFPPKRSAAAEALSLDRLVRDGPPEGDMMGGLEAMRLKILDQGIKSDSDGMVSTKT